MEDKVSIKLPRVFLERYAKFSHHFGFRSFNNFCDHAVQAHLTTHETRYDIWQMKKERVDRASAE